MACQYCKKVGSVPTRWILLWPDHSVHDNSFRTTCPPDSPSSIGFSGQLDPPNFHVTSSPSSQSNVFIAFNPSIPTQTSSGATFSPDSPFCSVQSCIVFVLTLGQDSRPPQRVVWGSNCRDDELSKDELTQCPNTDCLKPSRVRIRLYRSGIELWNSNQGSISLDKVKCKFPLNLKGNICSA